MPSDLFANEARKRAESLKPLADRMRPRTLAEFVGQRKAVGEGTLLRRAIENDRPFSMIFWGPPGCGKTTLARIIAGETRSRFVEFSAVLSGVKQIRAVVEESRKSLETGAKRTVLFVDEIHRFNKAQQDAFLPHVESGLITLIGSTTENPSFEIIPALMSRCRVITLAALGESDLAAIIHGALADRERGLGETGMSLTPQAVAVIAKMADGDARSALNALEAVWDAVGRRKGAEVDAEFVEKALQRRALVYDKSGESHYNLISAFHKSLRGSDPDASLYWLTRMLSSGEDPFYILRRMVRFASEDIGNADPLALRTALDAMESFRFLGHPEGELAIAQAALYLACAPKSNSAYRAYGRARELVEETGSLPVPLHLRNAPTGLMKELGYGKGYRYAHDYRNAVVEQEHMPPELKGRRLYHPTPRGYERTIRERLEAWRRRRGKKTTE